MRLKNVRNRDNIKHKHIIGLNLWWYNMKLLQQTTQLIKELLWYDYEELRLRELAKDYWEIKRD